MDQLAIPEISERKKWPAVVPGEVLHLHPGAPLLHFWTKDTQATEQYRIIRTRICHHPGQPRMMLISSPLAGDGKTTTALNLAVALSLQDDMPVLLMDCDFQRSAASRQLGIGQADGLSELLRQEATLASTLVRIAQFPNLWVLPPGPAASNPAELLSMPRWRSLVDELRTEFRFVIVDGPPVGSAAEYDLLQLACDGVILVVRQDFTNRRLCRRALAAVPKQMQLGVILNCCEEWRLWKTHG